MTATLPANPAQRRIALASHRTLTAAAEARAVQKAWRGRPIPDEWMLTAREAADLIERIGAAAGIGPITHELHNQPSGISSIIDPPTLRTPRRNIPITNLLHEAAHPVSGLSHHGPSWRRAYLDLAREHCPIYGKTLGASFNFYRQDVA